MTISSTDRKAGPYVGNGSTATFPFEFKVFQASDLDVVKLTVSSGVETSLSLTADFTVSLNADQNANPGGTITLVAGNLPSGYNIIVTSTIENLQPASIPNQGGFYPTVVNDSLDRATILVQQLQEQLDRSLKYPITDPDVSVTLPAVAQRAGMVLTFDEDGTPIPGPSVAEVSTVLSNLSDIKIVADDLNSDDTIGTVAGSIENVNAVGSNIEAVKNAEAIAGDIANKSDMSKGVALVGGAGRVVDSIAALKALPKTGSPRAFVLGYYVAGDGGGGSYWYDSTDTTSADNGGTIIVASDGGRWKLSSQSCVTVKQFGAVGDGTTDDTTAIQSALNAITDYAGKIYLPKGAYLISSTLTTPKRVHLVGDSDTYISGYGAATTLKKSATLNGRALYITASGSLVEDLVVMGVPGNGGDGVQITANQVTLRNVGVFGMGNDGIRIGEDTGDAYCNLWCLDNVKTKSNTRHGVMISEGPGALADANAGTCLHLDTQGNGGDGVYVNGGQLNTFVGGAYQTNGGYGLHFSQYAKYNTVFGGDYEANTSGQIRLDSGSTGNALYVYTVALANISIGAVGDNNRIECLDYNRLACGMKFPPTQVASADKNTLDDYVEDTFTPGIAGDGAAGSTTYTYRSGSYTKIGRLVTFKCAVGWSAQTGTGNLKLTGLPFTSVNETYGTPVTVLLSNITFTSNTVPVGYLLPNSTNVIFYVQANGSSVTQIPLDTSGDIYISGQYFTA